MSLKQKINNIKKTSTLIPLPTGIAKDFDELWNNLIEPNMPKEDVVIRWHELLKQYINKVDAIFFIRAFGSPSGNSPLLRRGFLNTTDQGYSSAFVDNGFTSYFYSMARDGYVPSLSEFETCIRDRSFPCGCFQTSEEQKRAAYLRGKNPGISGKGYKIAHIYSAGKDFNKKSPFSSVSDLCNKIFPRGVNTEWDNINTDIYGNFNYRQVDILSNEANEVRSFLVAHFMRMVHPINYFLVPNKANRHDEMTGILKTNIIWYDNGVEKDEIGEDKDLINYVNSKIKAKYKTIYDEFLSYIYPIQNTDPILNKTITAKYGLDIWKTKIDPLFALNNPTSTNKGVSNSNKQKPRSGSKHTNGELADFEVYAVRNGVSNPPYYSSLIKSIMKELNINSITDLEANIDIIIDDCTQKIDAAKKAKDKSTAKKYNNIRSALRKYSDYLDQKYNAINNIDVFVKALEDFMRNAGDLSDGSIRIYLRKIRDLLENGYTVEQICAEIDGMIKLCSKEGQLYDPNDHGNTKCALDQVAKMIKHPYIRYKKGCSSFVPMDEHVTGYCIDNNAITISYGVGFIGGKKAHKKISDKDMKELIEILDIARNNSLFEKSNTHIITEHGPISSYGYQYRDKAGVNCRGLFIDNKMSETLQTRYSNLINRYI